jgi:lactoylglutathione lyase
MQFLWTTVYVKDLDESIAFYSDLAELKVQRRFPAGPGVEIAFLGNGAENETLVELLADASKRDVAFGEYVSVGFAVDSADAMMERVKEKKIPVHSGPFETPAFKFFCVKDPNGLNVQFFERKN